jgi:nicotinamidase-related amidase
MQDIIALLSNYFITKEKRENSMSKNTTNSHTAFVVMDIQPSAVAYIREEQILLDRLLKTIDAARKAGMLVIQVRAQFRMGYPEISPRNRLFSSAIARGFLTPTSLEPHPALTSESGDVAVIKRRASAFTGSDLEVVLRSQDINHLVLCGIATSGVVLATVLEAADKDYELTVLSDCCADADEEVQRVLMTKIFPRCAEVVTSEQWSKGIE